MCIMAQSVSNRSLSTRSTGQQLKKAIAFFSACAGARRARIEQHFECGLVVCSCCRQFGQSGLRLIHSVVIGLTQHIPGQLSGVASWSQGHAGYQLLKMVWLHEHCFPSTAACNHGLEFASKGFSCIPHRQVHGCHGCGVCCYL